MPNYTRSWTDQDLINAVSSSWNYSSVLKILNLPVGGYNTKYIKTHIKRLGLDTSHFRKRKGKVNSKSFIRQVSIDDLIAGTHNCDRSSLKRNLINAGLLDDTSCHISECGITTWCNKPLVLQLDHIDGDSSNNALENLRLICPNCHSQTETFCGRNRRGQFTRLCYNCNVGIPAHRKFCDACFSANAQYKTTRSPV